MAEIETDTSLLNSVMFASMQGSVNRHVTAVRVLEYKLIFEGKFAGSEQKRDIAEGDISKDIQEV